MTRSKLGRWWMGQDLSDADPRLSDERRADPDHVSPYVGERDLAAQEDADRFSPAPIPAGWYPAEDGDGLRYWNGDKWTEQRAPAVESEPTAKDVICALSLAFGVAGALAWDGPVLAFYWPLSLGGAGLALALAAGNMKGRTPWFAIVAVIASVIALAIGIDGRSQMEDVREGFEALELR
jgi:hypothetical protein